MTRDEAIDLLVRQDLTHLPLPEREALLLDWWSIGPGDPGYDSLPESVRAAIARADEPSDPKEAIYDPLLLIALRHSYVGVVNSYLRSRIASLGRDEVVEGDFEELVACPCCGYRNLGARGEYEICRVCFWEDDGTTEAGRFSGPNHMTLNDARQNFRSIGAVTYDAQRHVLPDGKDRYEPTIL